MTASLVDVGAVIDPNGPDVMSDGIHPTNQGHIKMYGVMRAAIG
jgi:hypothetical protein